MLIIFSFYVLIFFLGASLGSFINNIIDRDPDESLKFGAARSHCFSCKKQIKSYDLIPVLSYVLLIGKCRFCHARIPIRILVTEILLGLMGVSCFYCFNFAQASYLFFLLIISFLIIIIDWKYWIIPIRLSVILFLSGFIFNNIIFRNPLWDNLLGAAVGFGLFTSVLIIFTYILQKRGRLSKDETALGWGDVWLIAGIGAHVGVLFLPWVLILACLQGIVLWVLLYKTSFLVRAGFAPGSDEYDIPEQAIPFGVFLALGLLEIIFFKLKYFL